MFVFFGFVQWRYILSKEKLKQLAVSFSCLLFFAFTGRTIVFTEAQMFTYEKDLNRQLGFVYEPVYVSPNKRIVV